MRKGSSREASELVNPVRCLCQNDPCDSVAHNSLKLSKQIRKRNSKKTAKPRIRRTVQAQNTSSQQAPLAKQTLNSTEAHSTGSIPTRTAPFELQDLVPAHSQEQVSEDLRQIWGYLGEIGQHLLELEAKFPRPHLNYSVYFGPAQRVRCVSLISSFCAKAGFKLQTQFLAFDIFHRICTAPDFERYHSALKAAAALYVAAKYQEVCAPQARVFSTMDPLQQVAPENIIKLEAKILIHLNFNLCFALPVHFAELLVLRYGLDSSSRSSLLQMCLHAMVSEQLWMGGGSLLAMSCMSMISDPVAVYQQGSLQEQLSWRVSLLRQLLPQ